MYERTTETKDEKCFKKCLFVITDIYLLSIGILVHYARISNHFVILGLTWKTTFAIGHNNKIA